MKDEDYYKFLPDWLNPPDYSRYLSDNYIVVDFETTLDEDPSAYNKDNRVVCSAYRGGPGHPSIAGETHFTYGSEFEQDTLVESILSADFWVAHNSKFEYGWLERCGLPLDRSLAFCTQIGEYVLRSNRRGLLNLNACLLRRGIAPKDKLGSLLMANGVCPSKWPLKWIEKYNRADVDQTEKLFLNQREVMIRTGKLGTAFTRNILTAPIVDIEKNGLCLDEERVKVVYKDFSRQLQEVLGELVDFIGGANLNSPKQMREVLYKDLKFQLPKDKRWFGKPDKDGIAQPTSKSDYIMSLKPKTKKQQQFQLLQSKYSYVNAAMTKALDKFLACVTEQEDNILYAELIQTRTDTQRLASSGKHYKAQMQNIHRIFKALFKAREDGWSVGEMDQSQLEYRVAVFLGQDEAGLSSILNGVDRHAITATEMFGEKFTNPISQSVRDELRTDSKADTFKPLYGGSSGTPEQVRYYEAFKAEHKGVVKKQNEWKQEALNTGRVTIPSGLTFYFPHTKITQSGYITNSTTICNYPVQSFATADIVPVMVTGMWYAIRGMGLKSFLVNTVHDSVIAEVHPDEKKLISDIGELFGIKFVYIYLKAIYNVDFNVPLNVDTKFASHWNDSQGWRNKFLGETIE